MSILSGLSAPIATSLQAATTATQEASSTQESAAFQDAVNSAEADATINAQTTAETETIEAAATSASTDTNADISEQFDTFLTLLTAQIKNQDPLAPLDSTQFVEQLATFSNLELQAEGNQTLENIAAMLAETLYKLDGTNEPNS